MKLKRNTELAWGVYGDDGKLVRVRRTRKLARQSARFGRLKVSRVRLTVTPVSA